MARGWESKSVEDQIEMSERRSRRSHRAAAPQKPISPAVVDSIRLKESLRLSVTRVTQELKSAQNPRYRALLEKSLADLELRIAKI